jgi:hypothetical protein
VLEPDPDLDRPRNAGKKESYCDKIIPSVADLELSFSDLKLRAQVIIEGGHDLL